MKINENNAVIPIAAYSKNIVLRKNDQWTRVITLSPGVPHSPHYAYHRALAQAHQVDLLFKLTPQKYLEKKIAIVFKLFALWNKSDNDDLVEAYLLGLFQKDDLGNL